MSRGRMDIGAENKFTTLEKTAQRKTDLFLI